MATDVLQTISFNSEGTGHPQTDYACRDVQKGNQQRTRKEEILSNRSIWIAYSTSCCKRKCTFNNLSLDIIQKNRNEYAQLRRKDQSRFIKQRIKHASSDLTFHIEGKPVCKTAFMACYGIKRTRFFLLNSQIKNRSQFKSDENYPKRESYMAIKATVWMKDYFRKFGDNMPDSREVHLPTCLNVTTIYQQYTRESHGQLLGRTQFRKIWQDNFPYVKIVKHQKLTICTDCKHFKMAMIKSLTESEQERLQQERTLHLSLQSLCRQKYYKHCKKAYNLPRKYASVIIDNMDQQKTNLPHFSVKSKVDQSLQTMKHHITGVLNHGQDKSYMFTWGDHFSGDSNVMINCLQYVLADIGENNNGVMPPVLYVQADNCPKDNKNRFIVAFLASLIKQGIFEKIKLSFLMVGHTHEDIDQMFSCVSRKLQRQDARTIDELHHVSRTSYTPEPKMEHIQSLVDYKSQLDLGKLEGIKTPHIFKIHMIDSKVTLSYKDWPMKSEAYRNVSIDKMGKAEFDTSLLVKINESKVTESRDRMSLEKYEKTGVLARNEVQWWIDYLNTIEEKATTEVNIQLPHFAIPDSDESNHHELRVISERISKLSKESVIKYK